MIRVPFMLFNWRPLWGIGKNKKVWGVFFVLASNCKWFCGFCMGNSFSAHGVGMEFRRVVFEDLNSGLGDSSIFVGGWLCATSIG